MAFGRQELTKDDLIKAGLNPDDLAELKANGVKKADLDTLKTELATSVTDMIKNQFAELETKLAPKPIVNNNNNNKTAEEIAEEENAEMLSNPSAYVNKKLSQSVMFTATENTRLRMQIAYNNAKASLRGFKNTALATEIDEEWKKYKPEQFAANKEFDPEQLILKIHNMVMGNHIDEIQRDTDKKDGKYNLVASSSGGGGGNFNTNNNTNTNNENKIVLSDIEKAQAKKYGMTEEEWIKQKEEMDAEETKVLARA